MAIVIDLAGKVYGRLTVLNKNPTKGNRRQVRWDCVCECGGHHTVTGESLRSGKSKSCGCLVNESRYIKNKNFDRERAMLLLIYSPLKKRHRNKFKNNDHLDFESFKKISLSSCFYCGDPPTKKQPDVRYNKGKLLTITDFVLEYNGIDRKDSKKGYEVENCVPCCKNCNSAKMELGVDHFKNHIIKIYQHWASK